MDNEKIWRRLEGESQPAFDAFKIYLQLEDRTLRGVAAKCTKSESLIRRWAAKYDWRERARAFDESVIERAREKAAADMAEMLERQISSGINLQRRALEAIESKDLSRASVHALTELLKFAVEVERTARELQEKQNQSGDDEKQITINIIPATRREGSTAESA